MTLDHGVLFAAPGEPLLTAREFDAVASLASHEGRDDIGREAPLPGERDSAEP
ncbi:hypothetical protein ACFVXG_45855 [Kitasatospora sp. NPDC058162]|uniref:hypothetical protein n=1 Tax=Kitasatospora sp. NPDC058162 TaxID=3346362 RepID=UPI0036D9DF01